MKKYYVKHYYNNPRNNVTRFFVSKKEGVEECKYIFTDDKKSNEISVLYKNGNEIACHLWRNQNLKWSALPIV